MPSKRKAAPDIAIPHTLAEAIKTGSAVAVLGAGASMECVGANGRSVPSALQLRDHLAQKFLGTRNEERDLATVAEIAITTGSGLPIVFEEIAQQFRGIEPSPAHIGLAGFRWRGLATTNYDRFIEDGYKANSAAQQVCVPFVKNDEPFDDRLRSEQHPVALLKLHGCIDHRLDRDIPLILSHEHYESFELNRDHLFDRLRHWAQSSVLVFIGYKMADPHIRQLIYRIDPSRRPQWYLVSPGGDEHDRRFWSSKNVELLSTTFGGFTQALDREVVGLFRALSAPKNISERQYSRHFRTFQTPSDHLVESLDTDFEYIHAAIPFADVPPERFYEGYDSGWCGIIRKYDFPRRIGEEMLYAVVGTIDDDSSIRFNLLLGQAGAGKSIALRRAAFDAATALDQLVLWLSDDGEPRADIIEELYSLTGLRVLLFVDHVSIHAEALERMLRSLRARNVPVSVIASEREAEWGAYCRDLDETFQPRIYELPQLSEREAETLVDLLERHRCLGHLLTKSRSERIAAFMDKSQADRQLLVALHELTQGRPFEQIILDEYRRIQPESARNLYLDIATMHQYGVVARAGAISRINGVRFSDFDADFLAPLRGIVRTTLDRYTGDRGYVTRHAHVSRLAFRVACDTDEERAAQLSRIIIGLDAGFSSDRRILDGICKGRHVAETFGNVASARSIFDAAMVAMPTSAFLFQQAAIMEMNHSGGSLDRAQELASQAQSLDETNPIYWHTLAEVARRKANVARSPIRAGQLRSLSRSYLNKIPRNDAYKSSTFCNILIDETVDLLKSMPETPKEYHVVEFDRKISECVARLQRAQRDHSGEAEFHAAEGRLYQILGQEARARRILTAATGLSSSSEGVFSRLAQLQYKSGDLDAAIQTLSNGLARFTTAKQLHLQLALRLIEKNNAPTEEIERHFRASYEVGDHALDARFHFASYLFWAGKINESRDLFDALDGRADPNYRTGSSPSSDVISERIPEQAGSIDAVKDRYFFIRYGGWPSAIFAHASALKNERINNLVRGTTISFRIRFSRKGPVGVDVRL